jgi:hypothetical protein
MHAGSRKATTLQVGACRFDVDDEQKKIHHVVAMPPR